MQHQRTLVTLGIVIVLTLSFPPAPVGAHDGSAKGLDALDRLQGEDYATPDAACDPADGQHTRAKQHVDGTWGAFLPYSGCGLDYPGVTFDGDAILTWFRVARNDEDPLVIEIRVLSDGAVVGTGQFQGFRSGDEPLVLYPISDPIVVPAGTHDIRIEYEVVRGPLWHNLFLDFIQWDVENTCENAAMPAGAVDANGATERRDLGWEGHVYIFSLKHYKDPEGDPVTFQWEWDDGVVQYGDMVVRGFTGTGHHGVNITVSDEPVGRCVEGTPEIGRFGYTFRTVADDWAATWDSPTAGWSCVGAQLRSSTAFDIIAGTCRVGGSVEVSEGVAWRDVRGTIRLDGRALWSDLIGTTAQRGYLSILQETEFHTFDACFGLVHDVYQRSYCSDEYVFFNIGR